MTFNEDFFKTLMSQYNQFYSLKAFPLLNSLQEKK